MADLGMMPMSHDIAETRIRRAMVWGITMHPACMVVTAKNFDWSPFTSCILARSTFACLGGQRVVEKGAIAQGRALRLN